MATYNNLPDLFGAIADSIRSKTGDSADIVADDFPAEISGIVIPTVYPVIVRVSVIPSDDNTITVNASGTQDFSAYNRAAAFITPSGNISLSAYQDGDFVLSFTHGIPNSETVLHDGADIRYVSSDQSGTEFAEDHVTLKTQNKLIARQTYKVVLWRA